MIRSPSLFFQLTERDFHSRFAGSSLGFVWALISPLVLLAIYSFVFSELLRPGMAGSGIGSYTLFVALGLWPWMMFADGVLRGMMSIQNNSQLVKKVAFPHAFLVGAAVTSAFLTQLLGYTLVLGVLAIAGHDLKFSGIPAVLAYLFALYAFTLGVAALLAAFQTLLHDVEMAVTPAVTMLQFLTPVIYPITMIPESYRGFLTWNPVATVIGGVRSALVPQMGPLSTPDAAPVIFALVLCAIGALVFVRLSPYFEDFL